MWLECASQVVNNCITCVESSYLTAYLINVKTDTKYVRHTIIKVVYFTYINILYTEYIYIHNMKHTLKIFNSGTNTIQ